MVRFLQWTYFIWASFWLTFGFLVLYPFFLIIIPRKKWHKYYYFPSKLWAYMFYTMIGIPVKSIRHFKPAKGQVAVYCPNHFSFLDIPILTLTMPAFFVFVGLHDLEKIPLFGYFYRNIHITVNRGSLRNRYATYQRAQEALDEGKNLVMFPEGGIWTEDFPKLSPFKDGPFRVAIEKQVPIIPVTIPYNWKFIPLLDVKRLHWHRQEVIFHEAIETQGKSLKDLPEIKARAFAVIEAQLIAYFGDKAKSQ